MNHFLSCAIKCDVRADCVAAAKVFALVTAVTRRRQEKGRTDTKKRRSTVDVSQALLAQAKLCYRRSDCEATIRLEQMAFIWSLMGRSAGLSLTRTRNRVFFLKKEKPRREPPMIRGPYRASASVALSAIVGEPNQSVWLGFQLFGDALFCCRYLSFYSRCFFHDESISATLHHRCRTEVFSTENALGYLFSMSVKSSVCVGWVRAVVAINRSTGTHH